MALKGQGDPRWIVTERKDGANVNNWHWQEYDATAYAKERIIAALTSIELGTYAGCKIIGKAPRVVTGECSMGVRKRKPWVVFDMSIETDWECVMEDGRRYSGEMKIPEYSNLNSGKHTVKFYATCSLDSTSDVLEILNTTAAVTAALACVEKELMEKSSQKVGEVTPTEPSPAAPPKPVAVMPASPISSPSTSTVATKDLTIALVFDTSTSKDLFFTLTDVSRMSMITQSRALVGDTVGAEFSLLDGTIKGKYIAIDKAKKLQFTWRARDWPADHESLVTIDLADDEEDACHLKLVHKGIPRDNLLKQESTWMQMIFDRMKTMFGHAYTKK